MPYTMYEAAMPIVSTMNPIIQNGMSLDSMNMDFDTGDTFICSIVPFSFSHTAEDIAKPQVLCWLTEHIIVSRNTSMPGTM